MDSNRLKHFYAAMKKNRSLFRSQYCLHPYAARGVCNGRSRSHTVQRAGVLDSVAVDGHVGHLEQHLEPDSPPQMRMILEGVNIATTFPGLCNKHDSELFRPIEVEPIVFRPEQLFLLAYRALLRETFAKLQAQQSLKFMQQYTAKHPELQHPATKMYLAASTQGTNHGLEALLHHKQIYDGVLRKNDYLDMRFVVIKYDRFTPILCATAFSPEFDYDGRLLQDLGDLSFIQEFMSMTIWSLNSKGLVIFGWHKSSDKSCRSFMSSLLKQPKRRLAAMLASLAFEHSENVVFSPTWWSAISRKNQSIFERRMAGGLPSDDRQRRYLRDDHNTAISAEIEGIVKIGTLC